MAWNILEIERPNVLRRKRTFGLNQKMKDNSIKRSRSIRRGPRRQEVRLEGLLGSINRALILLPEHSPLP